MRPPEIPEDDLYARLELTSDAAPEVVEIAWRALLKRHHPDIAGPASLEAAKLINIAHDWLSDQHLRDRYDRAHLGRTGRRPDQAVHPGRRTDSRVTSTGPFRRPASGQDGDRDRRPPDRGVDSAEVRAFLDRVASLTPDEIDRLALADAPPIAFVASIRRFLTRERLAVVDTIEAALVARLPPTARAEPRARDAVVGFGHGLVLAGFLADELSEPFRERVEERMTRGWEAAVGLRRYGANTIEVAALIARLRELPAAQVEGVVAAVGQLRLAQPPWPPGTSPSEDEGLRISVALAGRDAAVVSSPIRRANESARGPRGRLDVAHAFATLAGIVALRRAYTPADFARLTGPFVELGLLPRSPATRR